MGTRKRTLTARAARALQPGEWASRALASRGAGTLEARALQNGSLRYYLRVTTRGRQERIPLPVTDYKAAVRTAGELSLRYQQGERDLPAILRAEHHDREAQPHTLGDLLAAYCGQLERDGKNSAADVRNALCLHVEKAWPKLWATPANSVTTDDLVDVVGRLTSAGKMTRARQLRAHLRAAYGAAIRARRDATSLPALRELRLTANPAADLSPVTGGSNAHDRALSVAELRAYWKRIEAMPGIDGALLRFHLLTGGQRIKQLARATLDDYDSDMQTLRLLDGKGNRDRAREHIVPLLPEALDAMQAMHGANYVFTATAGTSGASHHVVNKRLQSVVKAMTRAGELERGAFTLGDLRRTVETRLAAAGVSKDTRAHLQSHGISGVQAKHYDRYDRLTEKRAALETLQRVATGTDADVTPIRRAR